MLNIKKKVTATYTIELTQDEICALMGMSGYGGNSVKDACYNHLGKHYIQPYEKGLVSFFDKLRKEQTAFDKHMGDLARANF